MDERNAAAGPGLAQSCPACLSRLESGPLVLPGLPIAPFPTSRDYGSAPLKLRFCAVCGHAFQEDPDPDVLRLIYSTVYRESPLGPGDYMARPYRRPFLDFFEARTKADGPGLKLLEIGCGDPEMLLPFAERGFQCVGLDPSPPAAEARLRHENISIVPGYVEDLKIQDKFDLIIMRFCLEHLRDAGQAVEACRGLLPPGGRLFIQVPNNEFYMEHRPPLFAAFEHIHYFTRASLEALLARKGFSALAAEGDGGPGLMGLYKRGADWPRKQEAFLETEARLAAELESFFITHPRPILYGCGTTFIWLKSRFDLSRHCGQVIDDTASFHGRPAGAGLAVKPLDEAEPGGGGSPFLLCLNPIYHAEVRRRIEARFPGSPVFGLTRDGVRRLDLES
jgi:SAM-dependent methyltransferase